MVDVFLNIYDLNNINNCFWNIGLGLYYSGIEIDGYEYSYCGVKGIYKNNTKSLIPLRQQILLGTTNKSNKSIKEIIEFLQHDYYPERYHPTKNNCNHFTNAFSLMIFNKSVPSYINRIPYFCYCLSYIIDLDYKETYIVSDDNTSCNHRFSESIYREPLNEIIRTDSLDNLLRDYEII